VRQRVLIYGGGRVGLGIASCLVKAGCAVDVIARAETVSALRARGLRRRGIFGEYHCPPGRFGAYGRLNELPPGAYHFLLVCTRCPDSRAAAEDIAGHPSLLAGESKIVLCQNGWGNAETFCVFFPKERIYNARVITGFARPRPNEVEVTVHADAIHIGSLFGCESAHVRALCDSITAGGIPCRPTEDIEKDLWAKMLYNCALNPLGAILNVPYGRLGQHKSTRRIMRGIVTEVFAVMAAAGCQTHWPGADEFLEAFYGQMLPATAAHESSTLQDVSAGKSTEIDALNGAVIALAERHDIAVPWNLAVYHMVKFIEAGPGTAPAL